MVAINATKHAACKWRHWAVCALSLIVLRPSTRAFSTVGLASRTQHSCHSKTVLPLYSTPKDENPCLVKAGPMCTRDTNAIELPPDTALQLDLHDANSSSSATHVFQHMMLLPSLPRTFDRDTVLNISIIFLAIVVVAVQVFSINTGISRGWSPEEIAYRVPIDNWRSYNDILNMAPIQTKAVTSATVYTIGDIIAQRSEGVQMGELDRSRIARSLTAGLIGHGPLSHVWYQISEDWFDNVLHWTEWWSFVPKVVIDQTLWGPFWNNTYIVMLGIMQFQKPSQIWGDIKRTTIPLIVSGLKLWPLAHCVTYGLVPIENRLLWVDMVEIVWVTILATQASASTVEHPSNAQEELKAGGQFR